MAAVCSLKSNLRGCPPVAGVGITGLDVGAGSDATAGAGVAVEDGAAVLESPFNDPSQRPRFFLFITDERMGDAG